MTHTLNNEQVPQILKGINIPPQPQIIIALSGFLFSDKGYA